eukprot:2861614-Rhodomonas_salina.1
MAGKSWGKCSRTTPFPSWQSGIFYRLGAFASLQQRSYPGTTAARGPGTRSASYAMQLWTHTHIE